MQVKKFEAPTIQEALETIKRELGPEAIILQTKKHKRGFGLMSKASVEITAAVSDRSMQKKKFVESRVPGETKAGMDRMGADRQAEFIDGYVDRHLEQAASKTRDQVEVRRQAPRESALAAAARDAAATRAARDRVATPVGRPGTAGAIAAGAVTYAPPSKITQRRYIDIDAHELPGDDSADTLPVSPARVPVPPPAPRAANPRFTAALAVPATLSVEEELQHLKRMMNEMQAAQESGAGGTRADSQNALATPALQDAFEQLVLNGIDRRYAHSLIKQASFAIGADASANPDDVLDQVASEILGNISVSSPIGQLQARPRDPETGITQGSGPRVFALVGPTGSGKTTTAAKLASQAALKRGLRVGLISLDLAKSASFDALQSYAKILNSPYRIARDVDSLQAALRDFHALDVVFVDTQVRSRRDPNASREIQEMLMAASAISGSPVQVHAVVAATTRDGELYDWIHRFTNAPGASRPAGIIATKLDEATIYGGLYNVSQRTKLPLLYFTTGQKVPEDIEPASGERLVALVMDL